MASFAVSDPTKHLRGESKDAIWRVMESDQPLIPGTYIGKPSFFTFCSQFQRDTREDCPEIHDI
jgi:hypothetical protein